VERSGPIIPQLINAMKTDPQDNGQLANQAQRTPVDDQHPARAEQFGFLAFGHQLGPSFSHRLVVVGEGFEEGEQRIWWLEIAGMVGLLLLFLLLTIGQMRRRNAEWAVDWGQLGDLFVNLEEQRRIKEINKGSQMPMMLF